MGYKRFKFSDKINYEKCVEQLRGSRLKFLLVSPVKMHLTYHEPA